MDANADESLYGAYLDACERGRVEPPELFLAGHPEAGAELRETLAALYAALRERDDAAQEVPFDRLGGFRLLAPLDAGGMGRVFLAEQESLGRVVALKIVRPELGGSAEAAARFDREAHAVAQLRHENIVAVHAAGADGGVRWLAMELVPGRQLEDVLASVAAGHEPLPVRRVTGWIAALARALEYAHGRGIVHRDVKPANVRIRADDRPLLLDFGVAHDMSPDAATLTRSFAGSPAYAAPEQIRGGAIDGRTDVYGLGVTLYQCLTGVVPFSADSVEGVFHRVLTEDPPPPRRLKRSVPRDLEVVAIKAMEKDPDDRYATAGALADDLEAILADRPIRARRPGPPARLAKWTRRHPGRAVALAAAALLLLAVTVGLPLASAAERRTRARALLADARAGLVRYREARAAAEGLDLEVGRLERELHGRWFTPEEDRRLAANRAAVRASRRDRDEAFYRVLDELRRAEQLDPDLDGTDVVRAGLFFEKWDEARRAGDRDGRLLYRDLVRRFDPDGGIAKRFSPAGSLTVLSDPPGATCHLFRLREIREMEPSGPPREVPVALGGGKPPLPYGAWALRVVRGAGDLGPGDLLLEVAGHPVEGTMFAVVAGAPRRIVSAGGTPVAGPTDLDQALRSAGEGAVVRFEDGGTASAVEGLTPAALAARGGVTARVWHLGEVRRETLPPGLVVRTTAAPAWLSDASRIGPTPATATDLPAGTYLVVLRAPGREEVRDVVAIPHEGALHLRLPPAGATPPGWVRVPADDRGPEFLLMEREVRAAGYLAFLDAPEVLERATKESLTPRSLDSVYWERGADGRFHLPASWRPDQPVVGVSWHDAKAYAAWAGARDGRSYDLPTAAEWERATGATGERHYPFGNTFMPKWVASNWSRRRAFLEPGMRYPVDESPLGVYDASGSVMEWLDTLWTGRDDSRWLAGGSWGASDPTLFRSPGGWGSSPHAAAGVYGFRLAWHP